MAYEDIGPLQSGTGSIGPLQLPEAASTRRIFVISSWLLALVGSTATVLKNFFFEAP